MKLHDPKVLSAIVTFLVFIVVVCIQSPSFKKKPVSYDYGLDILQDSNQHLNYLIYDGKRLVGRVRAEQLDSLMEIDNQ